MTAIDPSLSALATPALLLSMALVCALIWNSFRRHCYLLWLTGNQLLLAAGLAFQILQPPEMLHATGVFTTALYLGSAICLTQAMAQRMGQHLQWGLVAGLSCVSLVAMWYCSHVDPSIPHRLVVISLGTGAIMVHTVPRLVRAPARHLLDHISLWLYGVACMATFARPLMMLGGPPIDAQWLSQTLVWWSTMLGVMLLSFPYTVTMGGSALMDTMHTLRKERDHDSLTGLLNRRAFEEACTSHPYSHGVRVLVCCDIDHFKRINDQHGHPVGDAVLRTLGRVLQSTLREGDVVARMGGEEFAIALWHQDLGQSLRLVERVAQRIAETPWPEELGVDVQVTASFGLVRVRPDESLAQAMQRADAQLYAAKRAGRNCIHSEV